MQIKKTTIATVVILIVGGAIFYACQKEKEVKVDEKTEVRDKVSKEASLLIVSIYSNKTGVGSGKEKYCIPSPGSSCWIWFREDNYIAPNNLNVDATTFVGEATVIKEDELDGYGNPLITLNFDLQYNDIAILLNFITMDGFVIENDIIEEEDSDLLDLMETTYPCTIPAGAYPVTISLDEYLRVTLPVYY